MKKAILEHNLVPEHIILSDEETEELLNQYDANIDDLQKILPNDPVVKEKSKKEGDVLKIIRNSETAGVFTSYRVVRK